MEGNGGLYYCEWVMRFHVSAIYIGWKSLHMKGVYRSVEVTRIVRTFGAELDLMS